jgi:hypothetical protein
VKRDVFEDAPAAYRLADDTYAFYTDRLERALHRLFHPPPDGMAENVFATDRNDRSAQIRARLTTAASPLRGIAALCAQVESVDANLRETDTRIRQLRQDAGAMQLGVELHQKRGELTTQCEHLEKRKEGLTQQIQALEDDLKELKREETNQTALANKAKQGQTLVALAARYREAVTEIRARAAEQLRANCLRSMLLNSLIDLSLSMRNRLAMLLPPLQGLCVVGRLTHGGATLRLISNDRIQIAENAGLQPFKFEPTHVGCYGGNLR